MIVKDINIKDIEKGENIRQIAKGRELNFLMQTIKDNGLLQPIGVKKESESKYKILWGNRRLESCKKLGWKSIPAVVFSTEDENMTEEEFVTINAIENLQQSPNTLFEIGRICKILRKTMSVGEIAVRLGIPKSRVENSMSEVARIPIKWQKKIKVMESGSQDKAGSIPIHAAMKITKMRGLNAKQRDGLFEHVAKDESSIHNLTTVASLVVKGKPLDKAIKESKEWQPLNIWLYVNRKKFNKVMENFESIVDFAVDAINAKYDKLAIKSVMHRHG